MARYIDCPTCAAKMAKLCEQFGELYEAIPGIAKHDMRCDHCDSDSPTFNIKKGDKAFVAVLLPNNMHPNYYHQQPTKWFDQYLEPLKT